MALSYDLGLALEASPRDVLEIVQALVGGEFHDGMLAVMDGLVATCVPVGHPVSREVFRETWGFDAALHLGFALKPDPDEWSRAEDLMSIAAAGVADRLDSDAGFSFQGERKLMLRRSGVLTLYTGWRPWTERHVLDQLPTSHQIAEAPA